MTSALALVSLLVPDYDAGIAFLTGALGFDLREDFPIEDGKRWVTLAPSGGGTGILLARAVGTVQERAVGMQGGGRVWLFIETDDFASDHARMTRLGVHFEEAPRHEPYGTVAVFRDPWNNRWDLIERTARSPE